MRTNLFLEFVESLSGFIPIQEGRTNPFRAFIDSEGRLSNPVNDKNLSKPWKNSAVNACIGWVLKTFSESTPCVLSYNAKGIATKDYRHKVVRMIKRGMSATQGGYSGTQLWAGVIVSLMTSGDGYWKVLTNDVGMGSVSGFQYIPHMILNPVWDDPDKPKDFIQYYKDSQQSDGKGEIPVKDIIHFRFGLNPENTRRGYNPLEACLLEILTDQESILYTQTVLQNFGIISAVFSPKNPNTVLTDKQQKLIRRMWRWFKTWGRGDIFTFSHSMDYTPITASPEDIVLEKIRTIPEERICAAYNLPAVVVGIGALRSSPTFSNLDGLIAQAWKGFLLPFQASIAEQLTIQFRKLGLLTEDEEFYFDPSTVAALKEDINTKHTRVREDFRADGITRGEMRILLYPGSQTRPDDDLYYSDIQAKNSQKELPTPKVGDAPGTPVPRTTKNALEESMEKKNGQLTH